MERGKRDDGEREREERKREVERVCVWERKRERDDMIRFNRINHHIESNKNQINTI